MAHIKTVFSGYVHPESGSSTENPHNGSGAPAPWIIQNIPQHLNKHFVSISVYSDEEKKHPLSPSFPAPYKITAGKAKVKVSANNTVFGEITGSDYNLADANSMHPNCCGAVATISVEILGLKPSHIEEGHGCYVEVYVDSYC